jgi:hypothetical protein
MKQTAKRSIFHQLSNQMKIKQCDILVKLGLYSKNEEKCRERTSAR